jgi:hypothetical protein
MHPEPLGEGLLAEPGRFPNGPQGTPQPPLQLAFHGPQAAVSLRLCRQIDQ